MRLGIELTAVSELWVPPRSHFEVRITLNGTVLEETAGRDEYRTAARITPGQRICATGRLNIWDDSLAPAYVLRVRPAYLLPVDLRQRDRIGFLLRTSLAIGQGDLQRTIAARIIGAGRRPSSEVPLWRPEVRVDWEGKGRFRVDLCDWPCSARREEVSEREGGS
ncbi:MAG: hypothetical protein NUV93_04305 [Firmicutes bacterium]|nr:hypothetical protein [Bacillota bacterium]